MKLFITPYKSESISISVSDMYDAIVVAFLDLYHVNISIFGHIVGFAAMIAMFLHGGTNGLG